MLVVLSTPQVFIDNTEDQRSHYSTWFVARFEIALTVFTRTVSNQIEIC